MTYAQFLLLFLGIPILVLVGVLRRRLLDRRLLAPLVALPLIALAYMAPWDHTAAVWGLWTWAPGQTWGVRWWDVPPEEYLFCVLEGLLSVLILSAIMLRRGESKRRAGERE